MTVDIDQTKKYYNSLEQESLCDCNYCKNYYLQIKSEYPEVATYLTSLGVDIEKPFETCPLEPDENGIVEYYCCQYIVFGNCFKKYNHRINDVTVHIESSHPSTEIKEEHFVLGLYPIKLKMMLPCK